ncbi:MAG: hypothetical protein WC438_00865 [Candidatus Pacearchaeota archaeon]
MENKKSSLISKIATGLALTASSLGLTSGCYDPSYYDDSRIVVSNPHYNNAPVRRIDNTTPRRPAAESILRVMLGIPDEPNNSGTSEKTIIFTSVEDSNGNGRIDIGDTFQGRGKTHFYKNEAIGVIKPFYNKYGRNGALEVYSPKGERVYKLASPMIDNQSAIYFQDSAQRLLDQYGSGEYTFQWFLDGMTIGMDGIFILDN